MKTDINTMTLDELKIYRAVVECYGTSKELYEVEMRIKEEEKRCDKSIILTENLM